MTVDWVLLDRALQAIEDEPHRWAQDSWVMRKSGSNVEELCNTTMCLAGWTLIQTGKYVLANKPEEGYDHKYPWFFNLVEGDWSPSVSNEAAQALGFDKDDDLMHTLFYRSAETHFETPQEFRTWVYKQVAIHLNYRLEESERMLKAAMDEKVKQDDPWNATFSEANSNDEPPF